MAHIGRGLPHALSVFLALVATAAALQARALALGEVEVRSALGENLDARIPLTLARGESIEPGCFSLAREPAVNVPRLTAARVSLQRSAQGAQLRIQSQVAIDEPALALGIVAACPGQAAESQRDYTLLLDPRPAAQLAQAPAAVSLIATLIARIGDTLESIANAIFPRNRTAKKTYIAALREANPSLATLDERDPIPVETRIALPDLRTFAKGRSPTQLAATPGAATERPTSAPRAAGEAAPTPRAPAPRPSVARGKPRETAPPRIEPAPREERPAIAKAPPVAPRARSSPEFRLKLSTPEVDLTPSRSIDDRGRARLRDRQLVLDVDDQVAAVLALRNSVRQLESKVAELQLKLAGMPSSFPAKEPKPAPAPAKPEPAPAIVAAPKVAEPAAAAPKAPEPPVAARVPPPAATPPAATVAPPPPATSAAPKTTAAPAPGPPPMPLPPIATTTPAAPATVSPPASSTPPASSAPPISATTTAPTPASPPAASKPETPAAPAIPPSQTRVAVKPSAADNPWLRYGLWALAALLLLAAILLAWRLARRRAEYEEEPAAGEAEAPADEGEIVVAEEPVRSEPVLRREPAAPERAAIASDADLPTRIPGNTDDLRRRYIEERFPEIANRTIVLDDPASVVKGARLFYEDGALPRAVELLQFAIERNPAEVRTWLALFEIFRLERLGGEFAQLAQRFKEHHASTPYWRKVQFFGREIDPGNKLYQDESFRSLETIGPAGVRRVAEEQSFDPIAENWLNAPMDFENEVLANELRKALLAEAGINEQDLVPNPMPALRNVEMFTVA